MTMREGMSWTWYINYNRERRLQRHFALRVSPENIAAFVMALLRPSRCIASPFDPFATL